MRQNMTDEPVTAASLEISTSPVTPDMATQMKLDRLHQQIDKALKDNRQTERLVISLCTLLFLTGLGLFIAGYMLHDPFFTGSGVVVEIGIIWPIKRMLDIRKENIQLSVVADMASMLPPAEAAEYLGKWLTKWFGEG